VLEGEHVIATYLDRIGVPDTLLVAEAALAKPGIDALVARVPSTDVVVLPERVFREIASLPLDIGALAIVSTPRQHERDDATFCVLLDNVQDPGNVGTILRTAAAALSDSFPAAIGIVNRRSDAARRPAEIPSPSLPMTIARRRRRSQS